MGNWLSKFRLQREPSLPVGALLEAAALSRTLIEIASAKGTPDAAAMATTTIEMLRHDGIVVAQPTLADGTVRRLARFEPLLLTFPSKAGIVTGPSEVLGRIKIPSGNDGTLHGYRLQKPPSLKLLDRRAEPRAVAEDGPVIEAQLKVLDHNNDIQCTLVDVSPSGARLRCRNGSDALRTGTHALLRLELPEPIGDLAEAVNVLGARLNADGAIDVRVGFERKNDEIAQVLRDLSRHAVTPRRRMG